MKKFLAMALSVVLACSMFTACGDKEDSSEKDSSSVTTTTADSSSTDDSSVADANTDAPLGETVGDTVEVTDDMFAGIAAFATAEGYTIDVEVSIESEEISMDMPMVVSTDGTNTYMDMSVMGITMECLILEGTTYVLDSDNKVYYVDETGDVASSIDTGIDIDEFVGMKDNVKGACKVTLDGKEYIRLAVEEEGTTSYVYLLDGNFVYIASDGESGASKMTFNRLEASADADLLKLPADYTEITLDEYYELVYGDLFGDDVVDDDLGDEDLG